MYRIKEIVKNSGLKIEEITEALGISRSQLYNYMSGKSEPTAHQIVKMCRLFLISADYLLNIDEEK